MKFHPYTSAACVSVILFAMSALARNGDPPITFDEESPWPRVRSTNGNTLTVHVPQVERWTSNSFTARAAVEIKLAKVKSELLGVVWFEAHGSVDNSNRLVTLDRLEVARARFHGAADNESKALEIVRELIPAGARTLSLDYLVTTLGFAQAAARQGPNGLKHNPPEIIWVTNRTVLVLINAEPILQPITGTSLQRVINTPELLVRHEDTARFYLAGLGQWFVASSVEGPWSLAQTLPSEIAALAAASTNEPPRSDQSPPPRIIVSLKPAELLMTSGSPDFQPVRGTALQYAANTDNQLFFHTTERKAYLLLSGRWFKAESLRGPWTYVAPHDLPEDFARIPPGSPQAVVLASVPNTPQAELALLGNSVPTTATVDRSSAKTEVSYDGPPRFNAIEGTSLSYAINAQLPVIRTKDTYYALDNGVWFQASSPTGPWAAAAEVPEEIYTIPPSSPVYYTTFARVYEATDNEIETGYTPGYQGAYEDDGTVVYGTGWEYEPWYGNEYYAWGWTWGYSYLYVPWYQWWVWRPCWNHPGGLRAAVIENIYDRWQGRNGITHHDQPVRASVPASANARFPGHPALYGRFWRSPSTPSTPLAPQSLPANTLALNPYSRPDKPARAGEPPHGAQLLSAARQTPGGGRDLYASPDGGVYLRKNDGWYRRQNNGAWTFFAPTQGKMEADRLGSAQGTHPNAGTVHRPTATQRPGSAHADASAARAPDVGGEARASEVASLERQYYARTLAQMRAQNWRASSPRARPARRR